MMTDEKRIKNLTRYVQGIMREENGRELYLKYKEDIEAVTPQEVFEIFYAQLQKGIEAKEILVFLDKVINVFYKSLIAYPWKKPEKSSFLGYLMEENTAMVKRLEDIKEILEEKNPEKRRELLIPKIQDLEKFHHHYLKKENILFPYMEKKMEKFNGLAIMWALHDETREQIKKTVEILQEKDNNEQEINMEMGKLFFAMHGLVKKEELILFPAASEITNEKEWDEMQAQSLEYEFPFIEKPGKKAEEGNKTQEAFGYAQDQAGEYRLKTETGILDLSQIIMIFNALPVDMTFVDENNKVRFFSRPKDRIFPRSPAVIGRDVKNCHPPESVHVVEEIIDAFKTGRHDSADFWINVKGRTVLIKYFALRGQQGEYKGVLEVSQDVTDIKEIKGEKRLLQWDKH